MKGATIRAIGCASRIAAGRALSALLAGATALALGGCAAPAVRYYSLAGMPADGQPVPAVARAGSAGLPALQFEIGPVGVPERLARPQMVIRIESGDDRDGASTQVEVLEQQRWSSSFDSELRDAFAAAIAARSGGVDVTRGGRLPGEPVFRIAVNVRHFEAILDRQVDAGFGWTITRSDDSRNVVCQVSVLRPVGRGMDELVQGVQQAVAVAADRIAQQVAQLKDSGAAACEGAAPTGPVMPVLSATPPPPTGAENTAPKPSRKRLVRTPRKGQKTR